MAIARLDLLTHLDSQFAPLVVATLPPLTSQAAAYGTAIDQAFRALGIAQADIATATITDAQTPDAIALAEYYSLLRFTRALTPQVDVSVDGPRLDKQRSQFFDHVNLMLTEARTELTSRGYLAQGWDIQRLELDYLEPDQDF